MMRRLKAKLEGKDILGLLHEHREIQIELPEAQSGTSNVSPLAFIRMHCMLVDRYDARMKEGGAWNHGDGNVWVVALRAFTKHALDTNKENAGKFVRSLRAEMGKPALPSR